MTERSRSRRDWVVDTVFFAAAVVGGLLSMDAFRDSVVEPYSRARAGLRLHDRCRLLPGALAASALAGRAGGGDAGAGGPDPLRRDRLSDRGIHRRRPPPDHDRRPGHGGALRRCHALRPLASDRQLDLAVAGAQRRGVHRSAGLGFVRARPASAAELAAGAGRACRGRTGADGRECPPVRAAPDCSRDARRPRAPGITDRAAGRRTRSEARTAR